MMWSFKNVVFRLRRPVGDASWAQTPFSRVLSLLGMRGAKERSQMWSFNVVRPPFVVLSVTPLGRAQTAVGERSA